MGNILNKLQYVLLAIIILAFGYFFGTIILAIIGIIIVLMTLFFIINLIFKGTLNIFNNNKWRLFILMLIDSAFVILILKLLWKYIITTISSKSTIIIVTWLITTLLFGIIWNILIISKRVKYTNKHLIEYSQLTPGINIFDYLFILLISIIISVSMNIVYGII